MNKIVLFKEEYFPSFLKRDRLKEFENLNEVKKYVTAYYNKYRNSDNLIHINISKKESKHLLPADKKTEYLITSENDMTVRFIAVEYKY